jgi:MFS family permease
VRRRCWSGATCPRAPRWLFIQADHPRGWALVIGQAFLYSAVFFTQALVLSTFFGVSDDVVPADSIPFAFGNLLGPVLLGRLFDSVGRRPMITLCYVLSGVPLIGTGFLFNAGALSPPRRRHRPGAVRHAGGDREGGQRLLRPRDRGPR